MGCEGFIYETLGLLAAGQPTPPETPDQTEPYVVFRNQISISTPSGPSSDTIATDYFSLDVDGDGSHATPLSAVPAPLRAVDRMEQVPERALENGWFNGKVQFKSPMLQLHQEILDFCDFLSPTPEEQTSRRAAIDCVSGVIKYIWPYCKVEIFGSFRTGLYLPTSDIDVVIIGSNIRTPQMGLVALSRALSQQKIAKNIQVIAKARVPIIKFVEKRSGIAFDISFDLQNGPKAADYIKEAISLWPPLRPLCLILKIFLQQRELNEVYSGGIGSYALLVMLIAMLRSFHESQEFPEDNLGVLLVNFFDFYGRKLNTYDVGVSCIGESTFFPKNSRGFQTNGRLYLISIQDPQAPDNDIGKNSFNYYQIRSAFLTAFSLLTNEKTISKLQPNRSILSIIIRPDPVLTERKGGSNGDVTFNSLLPGAGEPVQHQYGHQDILCNWHSDDVGEEPLPRGSGTPGDDRSIHISGKKRKAKYKQKHYKQHDERGGGVVTPRPEEKRSSSRKDRRAKKGRWRHDQRWDGSSNGHARHGAVSNTWHRST